jgi:hypothetical protein
MMGFKFFRGYDDVEEPPIRDAFQRLMDSFQELDRMAMDIASQELNNRRNNYEIDNDITDWDVTLSDGLGEE